MESYVLAALLESVLAYRSFFVDINSCEATGQSWKGLGHAIELKFLNKNEYLYVLSN